MKTLLIIFSLLMLVSCGPQVDSKTGETVCRTQAEMRALCFVEQMTAFNHNELQEQWVIEYCANIYSYNGCFTRSFH